MFDLPLKEWFRTERERLRSMSWPQRLRHIWDYYKLHLLILLALIAALCLWRIGRSYAKQEVVISGAFVNVDTAQEGYERIKAYAADVGRPEARSDVIETLVIDFTNPSPNSDDAQLVSQLDMLIAAKELDYLICDETALSWYAAADALLDLSELFPEGELLKKPSVNGTEKAVGLPLSGCAFDRQYGLTRNTAYLAIPENARHLDELTEFVKLLIGS